MSLKESKESIFNKIAALKTLNDDLPRLKKDNSLKSINNSGNEFDFILDLFKVTGSFDSLLETIQEILIKELSKIEGEIKNTLKTNLKSIISCSINPTVPSYLIYTGVTIEVKDIDFNNIFRINPESGMGKLLFNSPYDLTSNDLNTFLYYTIQLGGEKNWKNILNITFNETATINNTFTIKVNADYENKTLYQLNNDLIDSVTLFETNEILSKAFDNITGTLSKSIKKSNQQLLLEAQVNDIISKIINTDDEDSIDDSFFTFSNGDIKEQEITSFKKRNGIFQLETDTETSQIVNEQTFIDSLTGVTATLNSSENISYSDKKVVINTAVDNISKEISKNSNSEDQSSIKNNIIENLLRNIMLTASNALLSPKMIMIFYLNSYFLNKNFDPNPSTFIKENKTIIRSLVNTIKNKIIGILKKKILKLLKVLINQQVKSLIAEQTANRKIIIKGLF